MNDNNHPKGVDPESLKLPELISEKSLSTWKIDGDILDSENFQETEKRQKSLEVLMEEYASGRKFKIAERLEGILEDWINRSKLEAFLIATEEGLIIASNRSDENSEYTATLAAMFENVVQRIESGGIVEKVQEITLRGRSGELLVVRDFEGLNRRFFLLAYASKQVPYRFVTNQVLKKTSVLLLEQFG